MLRGLHLQGADTVLRQTAEDLDSKNRFGYEARAFTEREAVDFRKDARRILARVREQLPA